MTPPLCPYCNRPLMKIDHYGEMLVGCIECNRWGHPGDEKLIMELMDSDLEALNTAQCLEKRRFLRRLATGRRC